MNWIHIVMAIALFACFAFSVACYFFIAVKAEKAIRRSLVEDLTRGIVEILEAAELREDRWNAGLAREWADPQ